MTSTVDPRRAAARAALAELPPTARRRLRVSPIADVRMLERVLHAIPGVIETGLFVGRADVVLVGTSRGVIRRERTPAGAAARSEELSCK